MWQREDQTGSVRTGEPAVFERENEGDPNFQLTEQLPVAVGSRRNNYTSGVANVPSTVDLERVI